MKKIKIPENYDYVGVYLTDKCHLDCQYCITRHHGTDFGQRKTNCLSAKEWIQGLNRLILPQDVPITLQGGEPFLYKGVWEILENVNHKVDIMTALPDFLMPEDFLRLKTLNWNKRKAPYPTIRVSYHKGQNDYQELIERIAELQDILNIGLYYLNHPNYEKREIDKIKAYAEKYNVELREKEFLGKWQGKTYGNLLYSEAASGKKKGITVKCKNSVVPIATDGTIYRCHSDVYFNRRELALGHILDDIFVFPEEHLPCDNYGLCSECDVKIKTNHYQQYGYTSVDIEFEEETADNRL